ncbi:MAG TPA: SusC/RagA family TonB-linked outer membrane protein [Gemmatimonadaceae bacterium]|nr:SusC/RagA family TonB-linked outer membrane protein [Gemmatimonadaceae bacterium]
MRHSSALVWAMALLAAGGSSALAQQRSITGTVTSVTTGDPVAAAQIRIQGTTNGALTDASGRFTLQNAPTDSITLVVRRIGFRQIAVGVPANQTTVTVGLQPDILRLQEQVITGQAVTVARQNLANDVATVTTQQINRTSTPTIENALQGKVAGATITANSGAPGGGMQIRIRGATSIFGNSQPLYVIDGVPVSNRTIESGLNAVSGASGGMDASSQDNAPNRIADLNPSDIQSIDILKGSSAAAVYGAEAANGVVIITTKHGQPGAVHFHLTQRLGTYADENKLGFRHFTLGEAYDYAKSGTSKETMDSADVLANYNACHGYCDMEQQLFGHHGLSYQTALSASGGSANTRVFASGLLQHDNGIMQNTGYDKQSLRLNGQQNLGSRLTVQIHTNLIHSLTKRGISNNDNVNVTPYFVIGQTPSFFNFQPDQNGVYPDNPFAHSNALQTVNFVQTPEDVFRLQGATSANYNVFTTDKQNLTATLDAGIDHYTQKDNIYSPPFLEFEPADGFAGTATDQSAVVTDATAAFTLKHEYTASPNGLSATTTAGVRRGYDSFDRTNTVARGLLPGQNNVNQGAATSVFQDQELTKTLSVFAGEDILLLDQRLFVSGGILGERTTNDADVNKFFWYPKASASLRFPNLAPWLNQFKIRAAFGETGNQPLYGNKFTPFNTVNYGGVTGVQIGGTVADLDLHPEREVEIEGGFDVAVWNSRLSLSATAYQKNNKELLMHQTLAPSTGYGVRIFNGGEIRNRGIEATLTALPITGHGINWTTRLTFARNHGVVTSLPVPAFTVNAFSNDFGNGFIEVGSSPTQIVGTDTAAARGFRRYGDTQPTFDLGFSNDITVGGFRLYGLLDWRPGASVVNLSQLIFDGAGLSPDADGEAARLAALGNTAPYIQDASFLKLREVTLSYQLPASLLQGLLGGYADQASLEISGRNLFTWTPYKGLDPEVSNFGNQNVIRSQDVAPYPPSRSFFAGINVDF